jgi:hypothetical protein
VADHGGFEYDSDYYGDDLPFWLQVRKSDGTLAPHLVVPYTLDCNDMRFALPQGYSHGDEFFEYLRDAFDVHYAEGAERPDDEHRHALPAARPARAHAARCSASSTTCSARPRVDLPPHRHRAPLEGTTPSTRTPPSSGNEAGDDDRSHCTTQRRHAGEFVRCSTAPTNTRPGSPSARLARKRPFASLAA